MLELVNSRQVVRDLQQVSRAVRRIQRRAAFAGKEALNDTAKAAAVRQKQDIGKWIDRPKPFTEKGFAVDYASKDKLESSVYVKRIQAEYLKWQVFGGTRKSGDSVPVRKPGAAGFNYRLTKYGNIPGKRGGFAALKRRPNIFVGRPKWGDRYGPAGIWQREQGRKKRGRWLRLLVAFEPITKYRVTSFGVAFSGESPFFLISRNVGDDTLADNLDEQMVREFGAAGFVL